MEERSNRTGKEWKFHSRVRKVCLGTERGAERDTEVAGEAGKEQMRAGWISMGPAPR